MPVVPHVVLELPIRPEVQSESKRHRRANYREVIGNTMLGALKHALKQGLHVLLMVRRNRPFHDTSKELVVICLLPSLRHCTSAHFLQRRFHHSITSPQTKAEPSGSTCSDESNKTV